MAARAAVDNLRPGETLSLVFYFTPVPKGRPRFGNGFAFTDKKTKTYESRIKSEARKQVGGRGPFSCPVSVVCVFAMPTKRRVDIDNLLKALLDGLNGAAWLDDSQVVRVDATKGQVRKPCGKDDGYIVVNVKGHE